MLHHLRVVNVGIIEDAAIELSDGFNVITGETGTGKTLLLGGLRLLLGEKADSTLVGGQADEARAEGLFEEDGNETAVVRSVPVNGRSRAYADGVLVSAAALEERVGRAVEIVGQHDQLTLRRPAAVLELVDASPIVAQSLVSYREAWDDLRRVEKEAGALGGDGMTLRRELDLVAFQAGEIAKEGLEPGEDHYLEAQASRFRNSEEIAVNLAEAARLVESMSDIAGEVVARLRKVGDLDPHSRPLPEGAELLVESMVDLSRAIAFSADGLEHDQGRLEEVERRLTLIGELKRKYGRTLEEVIEFGRQARERAAEIERVLGMADDLEQRVDRARSVLEAAAAELTAVRTDSAGTLAETVISHLSDLGMSSPLVEIRLQSVEPGPSGADRAELWFSSDPRVGMAPAGTGASGGELSRLVLATRLAARTSTGATMVFDEVDTGIGGSTALAMGRKLAELATASQVVCVTHLPQVAAFATAHFVVDREAGTATVRRVEGEERVREITRMLAGLPESEAGSAAATELLRIAATQVAGTEY